MGEVISFHNVSFSYTPDDKGVRNAVENVTFSVQEGEWIAIVGHNGSGKSTMAKLMSGLLLPGQGEIRILKDVLTEQNLWEIRSQLGIVFQNPDNQFVGATVQDDVAFSLENNGVPYEEMVKRVHEALEQVKMTAFVNHEPHHLSGGQKQRVAIASALAMHPKILILDEATSMLDPQGREEVLSTVEQLRSKMGITVLSITHDLEEAMLADRLILMNQGNVHKIGTPEEVFTLGDELVALGLDLPFAMKMSKYLQAEGVQLVRQHIKEEELVNDIWTSNFNK